MRAPGPARVALVTGPGRGLGRHMAVALSSAGLAVGLLGRSEAGLIDVQDEIERSGGRAAMATADVRDLAAVEAAVQSLEKELGPIDLLLNNAGVIEPEEVPVWAADPGEWWDVVETDLRGPFHLVKAVVPGMIERGAGRLVNLNSDAGAVDREIYSAYCVAKAGLFRISGNLHLAGFEQGIRAFEVSPGVVETDMTHSMRMHDTRTDWTPPGALTDLITAIASGRLDAWSGGFIRAGIDTPESLSARASEPGPSLPATARRLGILPYGKDDPLI